MMIDTDSENYLIDASLDNTKNRRPAALRHRDEVLHLIEHLPLGPRTQSPGLHDTVQRKTMDFSNDFSYQRENAIAL
jgi:hypothetical protein